MSVSHLALTRCGGLLDTADFAWICQTWHLSQGSPREVASQASCLCHISRRQAAKDWRCHDTGELELQRVAASSSTGRTKKLRHLESEGKEKIILGLSKGVYQNLLFLPVHSFLCLNESKHASKQKNAPRKTRLYRQFHLCIHLLPLSVLRTMGYISPWHAIFTGFLLESEYVLREIFLRGLDAF